MFVSCVWKWEASLVWLFLFYFKTGKLRLGEMKWFYLFIHLAQALESYSSYIWIWAFHLFSESLWKTHLTFSVSSSISKDKYSAMIIIIGIKHYFSRNCRVMANGTCSGTRFLGFNHSHTVRTRISCLVSPGPSSVKWNMPVNICVHVLSLSVRSASLQPHGLYPMRLFCPWGFSKQEYQSGLPCPPPGNLPNRGTEPRSCALQVDSLLSEPPEKPAILCNIKWEKMGFPGDTSGKECTCQCRRHKRHRFDPWVGKIPWRRVC